MWSARGDVLRPRYKIPHAVGLSPSNARLGPRSGALVLRPVATFARMTGARTHGRHPGHSGSVWTHDWRGQLQYVRYTTIVRPAR